MDYDKVYLCLTLSVSMDDDRVVLMSHTAIVSVDGDRVVFYVAQ